MPPRPQVLKLPVDPVSRVRVIAERSTPDPRRPRLPDEYERRLEDVERRSAICYAQSEEITHQLRVLAAQLTGDEITDVGIVPLVRGGEIRGVERR